MSNELTESERAIALANCVLERPYGDPDDDLALLARQFLRLQEKLKVWERDNKALEQALEIASVAHPDNPGAYSVLKAHCDKQQERITGLEAAVSTAKELAHQIEISDAVDPLGHKVVNLKDLQDFKSALAKVEAK